MGPSHYIGFEMKIRIIIILSFICTIESNTKGLFPKTAKTRISSNGGYQQQQPSYENSENQKNSLLPLLALAPLALLPLILLATTFGTSTTTGIVGGTTGGVTIVRKRKRRDTYMNLQNVDRIVEKILL